MTIKFDLTIIGFGVIGTESLFKISQKINKKRIFKIAIIEKDTKKIPGGIAYNKFDSKFGFFNNPLRLSNPEFIIWIKKKSNINKLLSFIDNNNDYNLKTWLIENKDFANRKLTKFNEIYFPRLVYSFFLEDKLKTIIKNISSKKVIIKFYEGELDKINKINKINMLECVSKKYLNEYKFQNKLKNFELKFNNKKNFKSLLTKNLIIGNGLLPPKNINSGKKIKNNNYIWDFYNEGGTSNLIRKIEKVTLKKNITKIVFIGNKAGLLEAMPELENYIKNFKKDIRITTIAPRSLSLEKAEKSKKFSSYKFKFFVNSNIKKIKKSEQILKLLKKEFLYSVSNGFNKYDVWTWILSKELLFKCYDKLSIIEKNIYNDVTFPLIRNITRYTYPNTVNSKKRLEQNKILSYIKDKVTKIENINKTIKITTKKGSKIYTDLVVNVSGPINIKNSTKEVSFINSLKRISANFNERGFVVDKDFMINEKIYTPGTLSSNFNPNRLTIIKAITMNSHKAAIKILQNE